MLYSIRGRATVISVAVTLIVGLLAMALALILARDVATNAAWEGASGQMQRAALQVRDGRTDTPLTVDDTPDDLVQVVDEHGTVLNASSRLTDEPPLLRTNTREYFVDGETCLRGNGACVWVTGVRVDGSAYDRPVMVFGAAEPPPLLRGWALAGEMALLLMFLLIVVGWWTWRSVGLAFTPVDDLRREIATINAAGTGARVTVPKTHGELQDLAETVNNTLGRLDEAAGRERRFISDASHDLRNPIAGLHTRLELALHEDDDDRWRPDVRAALRDTERLNEIVADLLELSRLDSRAPAPQEHIDLAELTRREVERRPDRVPIGTDLEPGVVVVANPVRLARVLGNLLTNAERHAVAAVDVTVRRDGPDAVLEVRDDGSGIPEKYRERVFERFARLPESQQRDPAGTGLGLPIAREIAETYGGGLRLMDAPRGARFVMRLPLAP
ncbi:sensor histidine kinase [Actinomadura flavalba]|uniref:sensor histidine kinase n=1 Tax=Actinomadura flavalba TaxID=1120938 RepID=UPI0003670A14|nr:HAMP domain-containing sensor histidine kinase [Actinomadura flavalba]